MTAGAATLSGRVGAHARGAVVGFGAGLVAIAVGALLPDAVAYFYFGAQLAAIGWCTSASASPTDAPSPSPCRCCLPACS